ncbi:MAG: hypothetical protein NTZ69_09905 [Bacteroidia bacterium]|nr:hypothetical protein [Bacteroidia bacterium]
MIKKEFKNIQVQARPDLFTLFEDTFQQSGANSKGEFLGMLLENYLNPDHEGAIRKVQNDFSKEKEAWENEKRSLVDQVGSRKQFSEEITALLTPVLDKYKGQKAIYRSQLTKEVEEITVNTLEDALKTILQTIKVD